MLSAINDRVRVPDHHFCVSAESVSWCASFLMPSRADTDDGRAGKRYNVLRNRVDAWEYDMDQLLFGTILFTLLAFLSPTVIAYHFLFALVSAYLLCLVNLCSYLATDATDNSDGIRSY
jgi:hypothetical protein